MRSLTATKVARCLFLPGLKSRGFQAVCTSFLEYQPIEGAPDGLLEPKPSSNVAP